METNLMPKTISALQEMVDRSFKMTAFVDRIQSVLSTKFVCNQVGNLIHHGIAHKYSGFFGDQIAEILENYNIDVKYGNVPTMNKEYASVSEVIHKLNEEVINYQNALNMCYKISFDNMDVHVCSDLIDIITQHNLIVTQTILLEDKIEVYGNNIAAYDHDVKDFWILKEAY